MGDAAVGVVDSSLSCDGGASSAAVAFAEACKGGGCSIESTPGVEGAVEESLVGANKGEECVEELVEVAGELSMLSPVELQKTRARRGGERREGRALTFVSVARPRRRRGRGMTELLVCSRKRRLAVTRGCM